MTAVSMLLIEDSTTKTARIRDFLRDKAPGCEIVLATDAATARRLLRNRHFDVLVLDIALPLLPNESPRAQAGLDFLKEITLHDDYVSPPYVVGITEHDDGFDVLHEEFESRSWPLYRSPSNSEEWLTRICSLVLHVSNTRKRVTHSIDFAIVAALYKPEVAAILQLPWRWSNSHQLDEATMYRRGTLMVEGEDFSVIVTWPPRMGPVAAAALCSKVIQVFRPRVVATSGICAGIRNRAHLGDVVFASEAWTWESGKIVNQPKPGTVQPDPHSFQASTRALTIAQEIQADSKWLEQVRAEWSGPAVDRGALAMHVGPMATGSAVVADEHTVSEILSKSRKTVAIDMEAYGIHAAAALSGQPMPLCFCVKSVCDYANERKDDLYQPYAAYTSARALERLFVELAKALKR